MVRAGPHCRDGDDIAGKGQSDRLGNLLPKADCRAP